MNTTPLIARLQARATGLRFIGGAMDLDEGLTKRVPEDWGARPAME